jgi:hypothetical protein
VSSLLDKIKQKNTAPTSKRLFAVVAGPRLGGKSTLAGTLPGKTLMLQASVLESGSDSAKDLASRNKAELIVGDFSTIDELTSLIKELRDDTTFDHVYVDGLSAITEMLLKTPKVAAALKANVWEGYRIVGDMVTEILLTLKELTYEGKAKKPKNVFVTAALKVKQEGNTVDVELETKGKVAVSQVTKLGEAVLTVLPPIKTENGDTGHRLLTKSDDMWPGRIDGLLADKNPAVIAPADLSKVLKLRGL